MIWLIQLIQPTKPKREEKKTYIKQFTSSLEFRRREKLQSHFHFQGYEFTRLNSIKKNNSRFDVIFGEKKHDTNHFLNDSILHLENKKLCLLINNSGHVVINGIFASKCARPRKISTATFSTRLLHRYQLHAVASIFFVFFSLFCLLLHSMLCFALFFLTNNNNNNNHFIQEN